LHHLGKRVNYLLRRKYHFTILWSTSSIISFTFHAFSKQCNKNGYSHSINLQRDFSLFSRISLQKKNWEKQHCQISKIKTIQFYKREIVNCFTFFTAYRMSFFILTNVETKTNSVQIMLINNRVNWRIIITLITGSLKLQKKNCKNYNCVSIRNIIKSVNTMRSSVIC